MADEKRWDVFLSYASPDRAEVEKIALRLDAEAHLKVFLDKWRLVPGERFIPGLQDAIRASRSCAVSPLAARRSGGRAERRSKP